MKKFLSKYWMEIAALICGTILFCTSILVFIDVKFPYSSESLKQIKDAYFSVPLWIKILSGLSIITIVSMIVAREGMKD